MQGHQQRLAIERVFGVASKVPQSPYPAANAACLFAPCFLFTARLLLLLAFEVEVEELEAELAVAVNCTTLLAPL